MGLQLLLSPATVKLSQFLANLRRDQDWVINFDSATVEQVLENFLQPRIAIAPEINQQPFCPELYRARFC